jgi:photosystem II stability/assembly factor-like uncharacterized protein
LRKPTIYQLTDSGTRETVEGSYLLKGRQITFKLGAFDHRKALVIDPVLSYSTLLGSGSSEQGNSIAVDSQGNAYITGVTGSGGFPTTPGAFQTTGSFGGAFVTKLDSTGSNLIYSTYLTGASGNGTTTGTGIAVDAGGNAYVTGSTSSADFPTLNSLRGGRNNLLITSDGGGNWAPSNVGTANRAIQALAIDKNSPSTIYAGTGFNGGIFKSTDGGANWSALNTGLVNAACPAIVVDPTSSNIIYAALIAQNFGSASGVYKSVDSGGTWVSTGLNGTSVTALAVDPLNPLNVYAGGNFSFFKSTNGGASWASSGNGINFGGFTAIVVDPTAPTTIYATAGGGGVFKTTNSASNWSQVNNGLTSTTVSALVMDRNATSTLYAGTPGGVFKTTDSGANWSPINNGSLSSTTNVSALAIAPTATSTVFAATGDGRIMKTTNAGGVWSLNYSTTTNTNFRVLAIDPTTSSKVLAGADSQNPVMSDEAFIAKLNPSGSALIYSTFIGGVDVDRSNAIAVDAGGNAYIAGLTRSSDFPSVNAAQPAFGGPQSGGISCGDAFVTKLNGAGSAISFSTYLGGTNCDTARGIAVDGSGNVYVTGDTFSSNLATGGAFQTTLAGQFNDDAFVSKYATTGGLGYFTYLGGEGSDIGNGIATDSSGNAYVTGLTTSASFPIANAIQSFNGGAAGDAFVTKVNSAGSALIYSTFLGGSDVDGGRGIAVDATGNAYVAGFTSSSDFPLTPGSLKSKSPFFKTIDGGNSWNNDNFGLKSNIITALVINPVTPSTLLAGTRSTVYRSTDAGRNWTLSATGLGTPSVSSLAVNPANPSIVYLSSNTAGGASAGIFKSTDGGSTWNAANNGFPNTGAAYVVIDPLTPSTLYAGTGFSLFKSTDSAGSWTRVGPQIFVSVALVIDPLTPTTLYSADNGSGGKVSKSTDGGATWQALSIGTSSSGFGTLAIDPVTPAIVYAAGFGSGLFKTTNGGASWTQLNLMSGLIAIDPLSPSTLYIGSNSGVSKSTNGGSTFITVNNGLGVQFISCLAINPLNSSVYAGVNAFSPEETAFVSKLSPPGTSLVYSTLLGSKEASSNSSPTTDEAHALALDANGNAYVTGLTSSANFPVSPNSYQPYNRGFSDAFVSKLTASYIIGGQVLDTSNAPVSGAQITINDGSSLTAVLTESDGSYQFSRLIEGGSFTVSAAKPHFTMSPTSQTFNNLSSNQTLNFIATSTGASFFTIGGQITNNSAGLSGVNVTLSGSQQGITTTDSSGNYSFTLAGGGNYTVTPSLLGFTFSPVNQTFSSLSADQTANFSATRQNFVVTNANDHGTGSLRQAILDANATQGLDTITFNIPGSGVHTIDLFLSLPAITDPVIVDAATQPGYAGSPLVELNGAQAGSGGNGFTINSGGTTIRAFVINRFNNSGISLNTGGNNIIQGNYIGLDSAGTISRANNSGIALVGSSDNLIGGLTAAARNVISSNTFHGITGTGSNNVIQGNFIGTNAAGTAALGNGICGIELFKVAGGSTADNLIGGTASGAGNLISANQFGIRLNATSAVIQGNLIGTNVSGTLPLQNGGTGVNASNFGANPAEVVIGGTTVGSRNVISGNLGDGVFAGAGVKIQGNFIGTDITGTLPLGNGGSGVVAGNGAVVGGTTPSARNIISANAGSGNVSLGSNSSGNAAVVQGNYIGTDVTGTFALRVPATGQSLVPGITIDGSNNLVGGLTAGARNVISGNGIGIQIGRFGSVIGNIVQGNFIGLNAAGDQPLPNLGDGISLSSASNSVIGGTATNAANTIAFSGGNGVLVSSGTGNPIRGNTIFSNHDLGIDLSPAGITSNDPNDPDTGANNLQNFPVLTAVSSNGGTSIQGSLNSKPNTLFHIDFYSNGACSASGNGEGARFFDTTDVTTDANGNASISFVSSSSLSSGRALTATATDPAGNTSEFSPCDSSATAGSVRFGQVNYNVLEDVGNAAIDVIRTGGTKGTISVNYASTNGTAIAGNDYTAVSGTLVFADGETRKTIMVPIANDSITETDEDFKLSLTSADAENLATPVNTTVSIHDNNTLLLVDAHDLDVPEGDVGTHDAVVTVSLSAQTGRTVSVNFTTQAGSATATQDFGPASGTLTFAPGSVSQTFAFPIVGDTLSELDETVFIHLSNPVNANALSDGTVHIIDDDPLPTVSISDTAVVEGNSGTVNAVFNVNLSTASGATVIVSFLTASGTATAGTDYVSTSGPVIFTPGQTAKTISVPVKGDTTLEANETFFVNLNAASNATIARAQATCTIIDDDGQSAVMSFSQSSYAVGESDGAVVVTVTRAGNSSTAVTVDYATSDGGAQCSTAAQMATHLASAKCDFGAALGTLHFGAGETTKTFPIMINQDTYSEGFETFGLALSNPTGGAVLGAPSSATVTINDDLTEPSGNAIDDSANFVRQHYHDFLNREPDAPGLQFWTNEIEQCGTDAACREVKRINVSAAFFLSIEFQETGYLVERLYKTAYGDATGSSTFPTPHTLPVPIVRLDEFLADSQEISRGIVVGQPGWEQQLENNKVTFIASFVQRQRFTNALGTTTNAQYVDTLNANAGNPLSQAERDQLVADLNSSAKTRSQVLRAIAEHANLAAAESNRAFVLMQFFGYLRRNPDDPQDHDHTGYDFWLTKLNQFGGNFQNAEMVKAFISSDEYRHRFGP